MTRKQAWHPPSLKLRGTSPGLTLLETIIAIGIASIVMLVLSGIFLAQGRFFAIQDAISETRIHSSRVLDTAGLFLSSADSVIANHTINGRAYVTSTNTLIVRLPSLDDSGDIVSGNYDYLALGLNPDDPTRFMYDLQSATGTARTSGKFVKAQFVDKLIFRYNTVSPTSATVIDLYVRTTKTARDRIIQMPLGRIYYIGAI